MARKKKKTTTKGGKRKWMQEVRERMERKGTKGVTRRECQRLGYRGTTQACLNELKRRGGVWKKRAVLAETFKKYGGRKRKKRKK